MVVRFIAGVRIEPYTRWENLKKMSGKGPYLFPRFSQMSESPAGADFSLGEIDVFPSRLLIRTRTGERHLEPRVMTLLEALASQPNKVVQREALINQVWPDVIVAEQALTKCISELRQALGDDKRCLIQTVPKRGYTLTTTPHARAFALSSVHLDPAATLAVVPFTLLPGSEHLHFLAAGLTRDITHALSLIPSLGVVPALSMERMAATHSSPLSLPDLEVHYAVSGSVEVRGARFRLRVELADLELNKTLWSAAFDEPVDDLFETQDRLVRHIGQALSSAVDVGEVQALAHSRTLNLSAYQHIQLAEDARRTYSADAAAKLVRHLQQALDIQDDNAVAHALLAVQLEQNVVSQFGEDLQHCAELAEHHLQRALKLDATDYRVLMAAGVCATMRGQHRAALDYLTRSHEINPNEPHTLVEAAHAHCHLHRDIDYALPLIDAAERAAPHHPRYAFWSLRRGGCYWVIKKYEDMMQAYHTAINRMPTYYMPYFLFALASLFTQGDEDEALESLRKGIALYPRASSEGLVAGLRRMGYVVPEASAAGLNAMFRRLTAPSAAGVRVPRA